MSSSVSLEYLNSRIGGNDIGFTADGGMYITLINATGSPSVKGTIVATSNTTDNAARLAPANAIYPIGAIVDSGVPVGRLMKVAIAGKAYVLLKNGEEAKHGHWCGVSDVAGRVYQRTDPPSTTDHSREVGHSLESKASGTNVLCLVNLHFN